MSKPVIRGARPAIQISTPTLIPNTPNTHTPPQYQYAVLIERFQPFHLGHQRLVEYALRTAPRVIAVIGSDKQHRSVKNPFTIEERERMVRATLSHNEQASVSVAGVADSPYSDAVWIADGNVAVVKHW
jgi:bifunctional NMN adenylyltransferase/nudix hydrolase